MSEEIKEIEKKSPMKTWCKAASVRAVKTMAQTAIASIGVSAVLTDVDWVYIASATAVSGILSILTSITGLPEVKLEEEVESES